MQTLYNIHSASTKMERMNTVSFYFMKLMEMVLKIGIVVAVFMMTVLHAQAAGLEISPAVLDQQVEAGKKFNSVVTLTNKGESTQVIITSVKDFTFKGDSGEASYQVRPGIGDASYSISNWVQVEDAITLKPNESKEIPLVIQVPEKVSVGGHYGTIFFEPTQLKEGTEEIFSAKTRTLIGMHLLLTVQGDVQKSMQLLDFGLAQDKLPSDQEVNFQVKVKNSGNIHVAPQGRIEIYDEAGNKLTHIGTLRQKTQGGTIYNSIPVDFIPFNQKGSNALPDQERTVVDAWELPDKGEPITGKYTAKYVLDYGNSKEEKQTREIDFKLMKDITLVEQNIEPSFFVGKPEHVLVRIKNTGNMVLHPKTELRVYNMFGSLLKVLTWETDSQMDPGETRDINFEMKDIPLQTPLYRTELVVMDANGFVVRASSQFGIYADLPIALGSLIILVLVIWILIFMRRKWKNMSDELIQLKKSKKKTVDKKKTEKKTVAKKVTKKKTSKKDTPKKK